MNEIARDTYFKPEAGQLVPVIGSRPVPAVAQFIHRQFVSLISDAPFPCVGARAAVRAGSYRYGIYESMREPASSFQLAADLRRFIAERKTMSGSFNTFVASFLNPAVPDEKFFEMLLWYQLKALHELDVASWDSSVSSDTTHRNFEFSFGGQAFFVVGLHGVSSRFARRFGWPTLVFNGHDQFEQLRKDGKMERFQRTIRGRDVDLQGHKNPNLSDFGDASDARQYSGMRVSNNWQCPVQFVDGRDT